MGGVKEGVANALEERALPSFMHISLGHKTKYE
jgi:hypothetical protein